MTEQSPSIAPSVMLATDGSDSSSRALDYALGMTRLVPDIRFILVNVLPQIPPFLRTEAERDGGVLRKLRQVESANRRKAQEVLEQAREYLRERGIADEQVETRIRPRISGLAKDIINEAEMGRFDALIVGRRGLTRTQEVFMGSVTNQLIQHAANVPLWINDGAVSDPKVLVAIDGSEASLRAVDHVSFILGGNPDARVDFVHVTPRIQSFCAIDFARHDTVWEELSGMEQLEAEFRREDAGCVDDFFSKAVGILVQAGFSRHRIDINRREITLGVARTIIQAAKEGGYGTIVVGRRGFGRSSFLGSISDRVIRRAENLAVWLVN